MAWLLLLAAAPAPGPFDRLAARLDQDGDGRVSAAEYGRADPGPAAAALTDDDGDGVVSLAELERVVRVTPPRRERTLDDPAPTRAAEGTPADVAAAPAPAAPPGHPVSAPPRVWGLPPGEAAAVAAPPPTPPAASTPAPAAPALPPSAGPAADPWVLAGLGVGAGGLGVGLAALIARRRRWR